MKGKLKAIFSLLLVFTLLLPSFVSATSIVKAEEDLLGEDTVMNEGNTENQNFQKYVNINEGWYFKRWSGFSGYPELQTINKETVKDWRKLDLPHDWSIELDFNQYSPAMNEGGLLDGGTGIYVKILDLPKSIEGKNIRIRFGGVYMDSTLFVNGRQVGNYPFGYNTFSYDITEFLKYGEENIITMKVVNQQPSSRWYSGSGIYRDVDLVIKNQVHIKENGTYITSPNLKAEVGSTVNSNVETKLENKSDEARQVRLEYRVKDLDGNYVNQATRTEQFTIAGNSEKKISHTVKVDNPRLWDTENPNIYILESKLYQGDDLLDTSEDRFGYRYTEWTAKDGFSLNGKYMKFHGVCLHHDQGAMGSVANEKSMRRQLTIMKEMGVNAIRTSHNPHDRKFIEICEELGLLVQEEAFDTWSGKPKKAYDYNRFFNKIATHPDAEDGQVWGEFDVKQMVDRDKNSPAIIMWSIGNEIWETDSNYGITLAENLVRWVKEVDDTRYVTMGEDKFRWSADGYIHNQVASKLDAVGLNYSEDNFPTIARNHPDWLIYGAETSSAVKSRGIYYNPAVKDNTATGSWDKPNRKYQMSDYGNDRVGWGKTAINSWIPDRDNKNYAGQFIWTGFDYIGEPTPWHNENNQGAPVKSSFFGIVDTAGFPKMDYYFYQSQWLDRKSSPMAKILPHWNWEDRAKLRAQGTDLKRNDNKVPVRVYSNAPVVDLQLNGVSLGEKQFKQKVTDYGYEYQEGAMRNELYLEWLVPFEAGKLEAIAKDERGNQIASDIVQTAGKPYKVEFDQEDYLIAANGEDLAYIPFVIRDEDGVEVPYADNLVHFDIVGKGRIVGVDNGNAASQERYKAQHDGSWQRKAFNGRGLLIVQSTKEAGSFTVTAKSQGLVSDTAIVRTQESTDQGFLGYDVDTIVVRKGQRLELPERVRALYQNGKVEMISVKWDQYDESLLDQVGSFEITASVVGSEDKITAKVIVIDYIGVVPVNTTTSPNSLPDLPSKIRAVLSNGEEELVDATWETKKPSDFTAGSQVYVKATNPILEKLGVTAQVRVGDGLSSTSIDNLRFADGLVADYSDDKDLYEVEAGYSSENKTITAESKDNNRLLIVQPSEENNFLGKIYVVSENGQEERQIFFNLSILSKILSRAELTSESTEIRVDEKTKLELAVFLEDDSELSKEDYTVEYEVTSEDGGQAKVVDGYLEAYKEGNVKVLARVSYRNRTIESNPLQIKINESILDKTIVSIDDVEVLTEIGVAPVLPETVLVRYDKGFPARLEVVWDDIDQSLYQTANEFTVEGRVEGTEIRAKAIVRVESYIAAQNFSLSTGVRRLPELPETVKLYHSSGSDTQANILEWTKEDQGQLSEDDLDEVGKIVELEGSIEGSSLKSRLTIRVTDQTEQSYNYAKEWTGSEIPAGIASWTNDGQYSDDRIKAINNGIVSLTESDPHDRWTNWRPDGQVRPGDWVGILFGRAGEIEDFTISEVDIAFFEDHGTGAPGEFTLEYYVGEKPSTPTNYGHMLKEDSPLSDDANWKKIEEFEINTEDGQLKAGREHNSITFEPVKSYAVRMNMKPAAGKNGIAITEFRVFDQVPSAHEDYDLTIMANGELIEGFSQDKYEYDLEVSELPEITAEATNNAAITIVPAISMKDTTRVIVVDEASNTETIYNISYTEESQLEDVDKSQLEEFYKQVKDEKSDEYTEGSFGVFNEKLMKAKEVLEDQTATQEDVDQALADLKKAHQDLVTIVDLRESVEEAKLVDTDKLEDESKEALEKALSQAQTTLEDPNASQEEIDEANRKLEDVLANLEYKELVDKSYLKTIIETIEGLDLSGKTESSVARLEKSLEKGRKALEDDDISQEEIDQIVQEIIDNLARLENKKAEIDKEPLKAAIEAAKSIKLDDLTEESKLRLEDAIARAELAYENEQLTEEEMAAEIDNLKSVISQLEKKVLEIKVGFLRQKYYGLNQPSEDGQKLSKFLTGQKVEGIVRGDWLEVDVKGEKQYLPLEMIQEEPIFARGYAKFTQYIRDKDDKVVGYLPKNTYVMGQRIGSRVYIEYRGVKGRVYLVNLVDEEMTYEGYARFTQVIRNQSGKIIGILPKGAFVGGKIQGGRVHISYNGKKGLVYIKNLSTKKVAAGGKAKFTMAIRDKDSGKIIGQLPKGTYVEGKLIGNRLLINYKGIEGLVYMQNLR